ncbi:hypothetical protein PR048_013993 [Dryococelus australis]|uniref:Uncharacterized protein n=1 Tax=Dryococelus australis TaxID=614101 RepID=A0ABQ9HTQ3_9NEOP|nr:hypothetical protein PR048_013993 [Dryococelus australis]
MMAIFIPHSNLPIEKIFSVIFLTRLLVHKMQLISNGKLCHKQLSESSNSNMQNEPLGCTT